MTQSKPLRIAVPSVIGESTLRHLPDAVEIIRYQTEDPAADEVDMLVPLGWPSPGYDPRKLLSRVRGRYVQTMSAGVEAFLPFVPVTSVLCNARGVHDSTTAEWAVTAILASLKWLPYYRALKNEGRWGTREESEAYWQQLYGEANTTQSPVFIEELSDKTVLIVGYGSIGKAIEVRLRPFEPAAILRIARTEREGVRAISALPELLPQADVVLLITPLTEETRGLVGADELAGMRRGALLVNAARGGVVDTEALLAALQSHHIRAALDVTDPEPLPEGHPLWKAPNLLLTPHVAGSTPKFLDRVFRFIGTQAQLLLEGKEPANIIRGAY